MTQSRMKLFGLLCLLILPFTSSDTIDASSGGSDEAHAAGTTSFDPDLFDSFKRRGLHFIHINARSLPPKLSELQLIAQKTNAATISVTESWLDSSISDNEIKIDNYNIARNDRNREGGGACIYIRSDLPFNIREDLHHDEIEAIWVDIFLPRSKPLLIGTVYRPERPLHVTNFVENFEQVLAKINHSHEVYILGDFNVDLVKNKKDPMAKKYLNCLSGAGFSNIIDEPTRVTETTESLIDHVLINNISMVSQSGVTPLRISDHYLTYCTRKAKRHVYNSHNTVTMRSMKNYDINIFSSLLEAHDWSSVLQNNCVNDAWLNFKSSLTHIIDRVAPHKTVRIKQSTQPWMTSEILDKPPQFYPT